MTNEIEKTSDEVFLLNNKWIEKHGYWMHPDCLYQGKQYLFTFEQALLVEQNRGARKVNPQG